MGEMKSIEQVARDVRARGVRTATARRFIAAAQAAGIEGRSGGWIYLPGATKPIAQGWTAFAEVIIDSISPRINKIAAEMWATLTTPPEPQETPEQVAAGLTSAMQAEEPVQPEGAAGAIGAAREVLDRLELMLTKTAPAEDETIEQLYARVVQRAKYDALREMLRALDDWIEGSKANHAAFEHRGETTPCYEWFHVEDIRNMVNDTARACGVREPWVKGK